MKKIVAFVLLLQLNATITEGLWAMQSVSSGMQDSDNNRRSQWSGKKVAFLGDSMTQKRSSTNTVYWEYLAELMEIEPIVFGISGHEWNGIYGQAQKLKQEKGSDVDAIFIFAGTNDYNHNTPIGNFYFESAKETNFNGTMVTRKYRTLNADDATFCGRINKVLAYLKENYPDKQIVILTPIHRGFAKFSDTNVQPEESYSNDLGLYLYDYVEILRQAASVWAVPLIDLYSTSGLYPMMNSFSKYFENAQTDQLHPNSAGNYRLAKTIQYQMLTLPVELFKE